MSEESKHQSTMPAEGKEPISFADIDWDNYVPSALRGLWPQRDENGKYMPAFPALPDDAPTITDAAE